MSKRTCDEHPDTLHVTKRPRTDTHPLPGLPPELWHHVIYYLDLDDL